MVLLIGEDPREAARIAGMLRDSWTGELVLRHPDQLGDAVEKLVAEPAACILLDLAGFPADPVTAVAELGVAAPETPVLVLAEDEDEEQALAAVRSGAQDCLIKPELSPTLLCRSVKYAIERKRAEVKLAHQAMHDQLTGLPNRALFMDRLTVALDRAHRARTGVAVLFLDVDNFKEINDNLGHAAGDQVLVALANRLRAMLRPMDTVARYGGDEFTFLVEDLGGEREVVLIAERVNRAANLPIPVGRGRTSISISIGIAMMPGSAVAPEALVAEADAAMYRAKRHGRGTYELFDESSRHRALARLARESALRRALERDELLVHYQPGVALDGQAGVQIFEALVRWQHPDLGLLPPREFVPLAEETGLMIPIGRYVLEHALARLPHWRRRLPGVTVSMNVSGSQLDQRDALISMVLTALGDASVEPQALCLEIQESALGGDPDAAAGALEALKATGVRLALDDFGTSWTPVSKLKQLPIDTLKLDGSLLSALGSDPRETPIVGAVVDLGHGLGCRVVAEGVETEAQAHELRAIGCDAAQGVLFGPPVPEEEVPRLLVEPAGHSLTSRP
jgi:diguanylate cyclase (GGDEF)-like protein